MIKKYKLNNKLVVNKKDIINQENKFNQENTFNQKKTFNEENIFNEENEKFLFFFFIWLEESFSLEDCNKIWNIKEYYLKDNIPVYINNEVYVFKDKNINMMWIKYLKLNKKAYLFLNSLEEKDKKNLIHYYIKIYYNII